MHRQRAVYSKYDSLLTSSLKSKFYSMIWLTKKENETSRDVLTSYLKKSESKYTEELETYLSSKQTNIALPITTEEVSLTTSAELQELGSIVHPPDFIVFPYDGVKPSLKQEKMLNHVVELALQHIKQSVMIIKRKCTSVTSTKSKSYIMAVNETDISKNGLQVLLTLIHPHDTLELIYVFREKNGLHDSFDAYGQENLREIKTYYEKRLSAFGPDKSVFTLLHTQSLKDLLATDNASSIASKNYRRNSYMDISHVPAELQSTPTPRSNSLSLSCLKSPRNIITRSSFTNLDVERSCRRSDSSTLMFHDKNNKVPALNQIPNIIIDYVNSKSETTDFFAIAPRPRGELKVTNNAITETILTQLDCNIILCKE